MDDILAIVIFFIACCITGFFVRHLLKSHTARVEADRIRMQEIEAALEKARNSRKKLREDANAARLAMAASNVPPKKREFVKREEPSTYTYVPSATQSVQSSRSFLDDAADIAVIANTIHHWNDNSRSEPAREERSVGVTKTESSWGFDDSDSRKSISSSMDTSSSWSSSSSDSSSSWSSSSDSGPSSDW